MSGKHFLLLSALLLSVLSCAGLQKRVPASMKKFCQNGTRPDLNRLEDTLRRAMALQNKKSHCKINSVIFYKSVADSPFSTIDGYTGPLVAATIASSDFEKVLVFRKDLSCREETLEEHDILSYDMKSYEKDFKWYHGFRYIIGYRTNKTALILKKNQLIGAVHSSKVRKPMKRPWWEVPPPESVSFQCGYIYIPTPRTVEGHKVIQKILKESL